MQRRSTSAVLVATLALATASEARATMLFDAGGFETYAPGSVVGQRGWSLNGGSSSQHVIQTNFALGTKSLRLDGAAQSQAFPTINYTPIAGELVGINADFAASDVTTTSVDNLGFTLDFYSLTGSQIGRFGLRTTGNLIRAFVFAPFNTTTLRYDPLATPTNVVITAGLDASTFYNFEVRVDFAAKTYDLYSDHSLRVAGIPFLTATATGVGHVDTVVLGVTGATNVGYVDNYVVQTIVPEPTMLAMMTIASLGMTRRRRV